jgi:hypothetical protein
MMARAEQRKRMSKKEGGVATKKGTATSVALERDEEKVEKMKKLFSLCPSVYSREWVRVAFRFRFSNNAIFSLYLSYPSL